MASLRELLGLPSLPEGVESDGGALQKALAQLKGVQESHAALSTKLTETLGQIPEVTADSLLIINDKLAEAAKSRYPTTIVEVVEQAQAALKSILNRAMSAPRPDAPPLPEELAARAVEWAQADCASKVRILDALRKDTKKRLGGSIPDTLESAIAAAAGALNSARTGTDLTTLESAAQDGEDATDKIIDKIGALTKSRAQAMETLAELKTEVDLLDAHDAKAALGPELARLQGEVAKAEAHLAAHEYEQVEAICSAEIPKAGAATKLADGSARYEFVKPARDRRMQDFAAITHAFIVTERDKIKARIDGAIVDAAAKKFSDALEKLDETPEMFDKLEIVDLAQRSFQANDNFWKPNYDKLMSFFPRAETQAEYASEITEWKALLDSARDDGAGSKFIDGITKLSKLYQDTVEARVQAKDHHGPYIDLLATIKPKVDALRTQPVEFDVAVIETEVGVLERKLQDAGNMAGDKKFDAAKVVLDEIGAREPAVFEIGKRSGAAKKAAKDCREELDKLRSLAALSLELAAADALLSTGDGNIAAQKFDAADKAIADAKVIMERIKGAKAALEDTATTDEAIARKKAAENAAHEATYQQLKANVEARKSHMSATNEDSVLNADIATITGNLSTADTMATATPPNYASALGTLQAADALGAKADARIDAHREHKALNGRKAFLEGEDVYNGCATEIAAWEGTKTTAWVEFASGNYAKCLTEMEKVTRAADRLEKTVEDYSANVEFYNDVIRANEKTGLPNPSFNFDDDTKKAHTARTTEADRLLAEAAKLLAAKNGFPAYKLMVTANWKWNEIKSDVARRKEFKDERPNVVTRIAALTAARNDGVEDDLKALEDLLKQADEMDGKRYYAKAYETIKPIADKCEKLVVFAGKWGTWKAAMTAAGGKKAELEALIRAGKGSVPLLEMLEAAATDAASRLERSARLLKDGPEAATTIATEVKAALETALAQAKRHSDGLGDMDAAQLRDEYQKLVGHDLAERAVLRLGQIDEKIKAIETAEAGTDVAPLVVAASTAILDAEVVLDGHKRAKDTKKRLTDRLVAAWGHTAADALSSRMDTIEKTLGLAMAASKIESFDQAAMMFDSIMADIRALEHDLDDCALYRTERADVQAELTVLAAHKGKFAVTDEIDWIGKLIGIADESAKSEGFEGARRLMRDADGLALTARLKAEMTANNPPDEADIKRLVAMEGGGKYLDDMVRDLDDRMQIEVMEMAFEARFGVDLKNFTAAAVAGDGVTTTPEISNAALKKRGPNVKRLYELCADSPDRLTLDNPFLHEINRHSEKESAEVSNKRGSYYDANNRQIVLSCGSANRRETASLADPKQLPDIDADCVPVGGTETNYFNWTSQHEVGHAIDDQKQYMNTRGDAADHGGWKDHGADIDDVAGIIATHYGYDKDYVAELMTGNPSPGTPEPVGDTHPDIWEEARREVHKWYSVAKTDASMWQNGSVCAKYTFGGEKRIYHEAYPSQWVSYLLAARSKGVTGYQFRAPGEWFSELYAAYTTEKLNPDHPAVGWLEKL